MSIACALFLLAIMGLASSDAPVRRERLYFWAATSTRNTDAYPANLYEVENGKLKLITEVVGSPEGVQFVRHYDGVLTIGSPHGQPTTLHLVGVRNGTPSVSSVPFGFDTSQMTVQIIADSRQLGLSEAFELESKWVDREILGVVNGKVIYRVNRRIFVGDVEDSGVQNSKVIAEGHEVPAIHWLVKSNHRVCCRTASGPCAFSGTGRRIFVYLRRAVRAAAALLR